MTTRQGWVTAAEAARLLGVARASLYAYVSRGFIRSQATPGRSRERVYARDDVERLRRRSEARREPEKAAAHALQWGMPILESSIALIDGRRLYYRGRDAGELARSRSLEDVASLIWTGEFGVVPASRHAGPVPPFRRDLTFVARAQSALAAAAARDHAAMDLRPAAVAATGVRILRLLTAVAAGRGVDPDRADVALAHRWSVGRTGVPILRAALVLCADHELNVSSFTARCIASAGSPPYAVVIGGLAALEGPRHGGAGARVESMLDSIPRGAGVHRAIRDRVRRGETIEGFGHPLYRDGDPRARLLLELLDERAGRSAAYRFIQQVVDAAGEVTGERPNIDLALAAVSRVLGLPPGSPLTLFAIGRSVGWIGHAIEQYATGLLIRPRARYVGPMPEASTPVPEK